MSRTSSRSGLSKAELIQIVARERLTDGQYVSIKLEDLESVAKKVSLNRTLAEAIEDLKARDICLDEDPGFPAEIKKAYSWYSKLHSEPENKLRAEVERIDASHLAWVQSRDDELFKAATAEHYAHEIKKGYWLLHEAVCLLLGKNPQDFSKEDATGLEDSRFGKHYRQLGDLIQRALIAKQLRNMGTSARSCRLGPENIVRWAFTKEIVDVPPALMHAFITPTADKNVPVTPPPRSKDQSPGTSGAPPSSDLGKKYEALKQELDDAKKKLETAERELRGALRVEKTTSLIITALLYTKLIPAPEKASSREVAKFINSVFSSSIAHTSISQFVVNLGDDIEKILSEAPKRHGKNYREKVER